MDSTDNSEKQNITEVQRRQRSFALALKNDYNKYIRLGRWNYYSALTIRWLSAAAGVVAGFFGLTNFASSATVGGIAAAAGILLAKRQIGITDVPRGSPDFKIAWNIKYPNFPMWITLPRLPLITIDLVRP